jgi:alpha-beta hydrolase superfamily lysophospholipase
VTQRDVSFFSDGESVEGTLAVPGKGEAGSLPAVVLGHGFGSFRDELTGFVELAEKLAARGVASLRIDYRGCGKSGRRGHVHPFPDWILDTLAACEFLRSLDETDADLIGLGGMSVGGGVVCTAGALDRRIRAIVSLAPVADGGWWLEHLWRTTAGEEGWRTFLGHLEEDRIQCSVTGKSEVVPIGALLAYGPEDEKIVAEIYRTYPQFVDRLTLSSGSSLLNFKPLETAHAVEAPIRFIHSDADTSVPHRHSEELFSRVKGKRDLRIVTGSPHCFWVGERSEEVQNLAADWLLEHL